MPDLAEVLRSALVLEVQDRAILAEKLLASLDDLGRKMPSASGLVKLASGL